MNKTNIFKASLIATAIITIFSSTNDKVFANMECTEVKNDKIRRLVSIKETTLSKDGKYVDLFFSILDIDENLNKEKLIEDLNKLKGFFRKAIGSELTIRHTPEVRIHIDNTAEYGVKISKILNDIK